MTRWNPIRKGSVDKYESGRRLNRPKDDAKFDASHERRNSMDGRRYSSLDTSRWGGRIRLLTATAHDEAVATTLRPYGTGINTRGSFPSSESICQHKCCPLSSGGHVRMT